MTNPAFGEFITITNRLDRRRKTVTVKLDYRSDSYETQKYWSRRETKEARALFLGMRTLKNGTIYSEEDGWIIFTEQSSFRAALVCTGPNSKPFYTDILGVVNND
jgi:hypothetical protein